MAALFLAVTASSGSAASPHRGRILGVVPRSGPPAVAPHRLSRSKAINAVGPTTLTFDPSYQTDINQYFTDVAHDKGLSTNVYSVATQNSDTSGAVQYKSTFGGSYVDKDRCRRTAATTASTRTASRTSRSRTRSRPS